MGRKYDRFWALRRRCARWYHEAFQEVPESTIPYVAPGGQHACHLYVIQMNLERLRVSRNAFMELLKQENIGASVHFIPLHLHPYYRDTFGHRPEDFPTASAVFARIISLPIYPKLTEADAQRVIDTVTRLVRQHRR
jgi:dTDP-4-amino-4,6-dideoxygalactose transaminase